MLSQRVLPQNWMRWDWGQNPVSRPGPLSSNSGSDGPLELLEYHSYGRLSSQSFQIAHGIDQHMQIYLSFIDCPIGFKQVLCVDPQRIPN